MSTRHKPKTKKNFICQEEVFDTRGNFLGYVEECDDGLYNHYDQDGRFIIATTSRKLDYSKYRKED